MDPCVLGKVRLPALALAVDYSVARLWLVRDNFDGHRLVFPLHNVARSELAATARFGFSVDLNLAILNYNLRLTARGNDSLDFQKLVETDGGLIL